MDALPVEGLPAGWTAVSLREFVSSRSESVDPGRSADQLFVLYSVPAHDTGHPERVLGHDIGSTKQRVAPGSVLLCKINPRINRVWCVQERDDDTPLIASTEWIAFPRNAAVLPEYLRYFLMREQVRRHLAANASGVGGSLMRINSTIAGSLTIPLAPFAEQVRIVAAVNSAFDEVEAGEAAIVRAREALNQFRASLRHAACTGALTADWRAVNPTNKTGEDLLGATLAQRKQQWPGRFQPPVRLARTDLPSLPSGWCWATLDQLSVQPPRNGISVKGSAEPPGTPALRLDAMREDGLDFARRRFIDIPAAKAADLAIKEGDFLISRANGSLPLMGRASVAGAPPTPTVFPDTMIRFRMPYRELAQWVAVAWRSTFVRQHLEQRAKTSAGIWKISQDDMRSAPIPLPPPREIGAVLAAVTDAAVESEALPAKGFAAQLRQTILHATFTGRLVPQDPADEPAAALLARLHTAPATTRRPRRCTAAAQPDLIETPA